jgi:hypothetical protein
MQKTTFVEDILMSEKTIEDYITEILTGEAQENALTFVAHLRAKDMQIERFKFYGEDKLHWEIKYKDKILCYILINAPDETFGWTIMPDNGSTSRFADFQLDEEMKEVAWKNLNICHDGRCGGCSEGTGRRIKVFGKEIENVCPMAYNFTNPDNMALKLAMKMMGIRKSDIFGKI